jgi:hypothetical protein
LHHEAQKDALIPYEQAFFVPAAIKKSLIATKERKQMSTKTSFKRIALVAVSALGFGLMSTVPANAGDGDAAVTAVSAGTPGIARVGVTSGTTTITLTVPAATADIDLTAQITSAPSTSTAAVLSVAAGTATGGSFADTATKTASALAAPLNDATGVAIADGFSAPAAPATTATVTVSLRADVAGTYTILVAAGGSATTGYAAGMKSASYSVTTRGAPTSMSISNVGQVVENAAAGFGVNTQVTLKDADGNATILGNLEAIDVASSNTTTTDVTNCAGVALATLASPSATGVYSLCVEDDTIAASGTAVITFTGAGTLPATFTSNTTVTVVNTTAAPAAAQTLTSATGYALNGGVYYTAAKTSHGFTYAEAVAADSTFGVEVNQTGTGARDYATSVVVPAADDTVDFSVATTFSSTGITSLAVNMTGRAAVTITREAAVANKIAIEGQSSVLVPTGSTVPMTVSIKDQFGNAVANTAITVVATGRTAIASTVLGVTDANGLLTYSFKDTGTTGTTNTVTFSASLTTPAGSAVAKTVGDAASFAITYGTVTVDTVTVSGGSKAETVAGSTLTAISAADNGPESSYKSIKAVLKDANGNLLAGVPVTFTVSSGAIVKTTSVDYALVYTGTDGSATTRVFDWKEGKQTITATAGGKSGTDYLNWASTTATAARVLTGSVKGEIVSYKVVDRFGNPVRGVTISLTRTGSGLFGNGASSQTITTDAAGTADASFNGDGTVVAELATTSQAYDLAGEIFATAATAAVAGTTKGTGNTLTGAGVGKVSLTVAAGSDAASQAANAAADAAAEAIDAANAATDAANLAAEAADAATVAAEEARDAADAATAAVEELATQVATLMAALKAQITTLANTVAKIAKKVKA